MIFLKYVFNAYILLPPFYSPSFLLSTVNSNSVQDVEEDAHLDFPDQQQDLNAVRHLLQPHLLLAQQQHHQQLNHLPVECSPGSDQPLLKVWHSEQDLLLLTAL